MARADVNYGLVSSSYLVDERLYFLKFFRELALSEADNGHFF